MEGRSVLQFAVNVSFRGGARQRENNFLHLARLRHPGPPRHHAVQDLGVFGEVVSQHDRPRNRLGADAPALRRLMGGQVQQAGQAMHGARARLIDFAWIPVVLTIASVGLIAMVGLWQCVGVLPPSYHYFNRGGSLDRYLLPLFPIAIILMLWALRDVNLMMPVAWVAISCIAVYSTAATRDYLVYIGAVWDMGYYANSIGADNSQIDAGSGWDGYHVYTNGQENGSPVRTTGRAPWWIYLYARAIDSTYYVTTNPANHKGYVVIEKQEYSSWLEDDTVYVYLVRRLDSE